MAKCRYCKQEIEEKDTVIDGMHEICFLHVDEIAEGEKDL